MYLLRKILTFLFTWRSKIITALGALKSVQITDIQIKILSSALQFDVFGHATQNYHSDNTKSNTYYDCLVLMDLGLLRRKKSQRGKNQYFKVTTLGKTFIKNHLGLR